MFDFDRLLTIFVIGMFVLLMWLALLGSFYGAK